MTFTSKDDYSRESKFEVSRRLETELLCLYPGFIWINPTFQIPQKSLVAEWAGKPGKEWNVKRFNAIDAKCIDWLGIIAPSHASALTRPPPVFALANRDFVAYQVKRGVCIQ